MISAKGQLNQDPRQARYYHGMMWISLVTAYKIWHNLFRPATSSTQISLLTILAWLLAIHFKLNSKSSRKPFNTPPQYMPFGFPVPSNIPDRMLWVDVQICKSIRKAPRPRSGKDRLRPTVLWWVTEAPEVGGVGLLRVKWNSGPTSQQHLPLTRQRAPCGVLA